MVVEFNWLTYKSKLTDEKCALAQRSYNWKRRRSEMIFEKNKLEVESKEKM